MSPSLRSTVAIRESSATALFTASSAPFGGKRCMGIVSRGNQYLGMFGARQQLLEFLILTRLGVDLADALEGKARLLDAAPLRTRGLFDTSNLLGGSARGFKAGAVRIQRLECRAPCPCIDHRNVMRRIEQALVLVLAAQIHHHTDALRKLAHAGNAAVNFTRLRPSAERLRCTVNPSVSCGPSKSRASTLASASPSRTVDESARSPKNK